jgi:hypothetical protein
MKIISVREMSPSAGKETLMEERLRRASGVMARHGAVSRIFKIGAGAGAGNYLLMNLFNSFSEGMTSFQKYSADPELEKLFMERAANPAGDIMGPDLYRSVYGDPPAKPATILINRAYHVPRGKVQDMLAMAPELEALFKKVDVSIGVVMPVIAANNEMMGITYRFTSMDHMGTALDTMVENQDFQNLITKANEVGTLKMSRVLSLM